MINLDFLNIEVNQSTSEDEKNEIANNIPLIISKHLNSINNSLKQSFYLIKKTTSLECHQELESILTAIIKKLHVLSENSTDNKRPFSEVKNYDDEQPAQKKLKI